MNMLKCFLVPGILLVLLLSAAGNSISTFDNEDTGGESEDSQDENSIFIFLAIIVTFTAWLSVFIIHSLGHLIVLNYYQFRGINPFHIRNKPISSQPYGKMLRAGYLLERLYVILTVLLLLPVLFFEFPDNNYHRALFLIWFTTIIFHGSLRFSIHKLFGEEKKYQDFNKLMRIGNWITRGCSCGSRTFDMEKNLVCHECKKTVEIFPEPKKGGFITLAHLNPFFRFSPKSKNVSHLFRVNANTEKIFHHILSPLTEKTKRKLKLDDYQRIKQKEASARTRAVPVNSKLIGKIEPIYLHYKLTFMGDEIDLKYYIAGDSENRSTVMIEQKTLFLMSTFQAKRHFRKLAGVMKKELDRKKN